MFEGRLSKYVRVLAVVATIQFAAAGTAVPTDSAFADQAVTSQPLPAQTNGAANSGAQGNGTQANSGQMNGSQMTGTQGSPTGNLHICNADEITSIPELQSDSAYDCINAQNYDETPKALMCGNAGKAFCCTQNVDQLGKCTPILGGKKRSAPLHEPMTPKGEPGSMENPPAENMPMENTQP
ncbi:MAG TPA: hypothetical protein VM639_12420 [Dongiaceae bacterium]|nr:hypothetical protein [Dongiaceae bacterium]